MLIKYLTCILLTSFEFTDLEAANIPNEIVIVLGELLKAIIGYGGTPMERQEPTSRHILNGTHSELISKGFQTSFRLNLDEEGISIESAI